MLCLSTRATLRLSLDRDEKQQNAHLSFFCGSHALFTGPASTSFNKFFFKTKSHSTIHIFKNYFITMFSIFSNKWFPNRPQISSQILLLKLPIFFFLSLNRKIECSKRWLSQSVQYDFVVIMQFWSASVAKMAKLKASIWGKNFPPHQPNQNKIKP